jgi:hypothetical protein
MDQNEHALKPRHLGVPLGTSKMISEPMARLTQIEHISCTDTNTVSKRIQIKFHMTHVTEEFHLVDLKHFLSLWYVRYKPCTYLKSRLALSPNRLTRASTDPHHLKVLLGAFKIISESMVCLAQTVHLSCTDTNTISKQTKNEILLEPRHQGVPSGASKTISEPMVHSVQTVHLSCVKISTISKRTETGIHILEPRHQGVPSSASKMISDPMVHWAQTVHLSCVDTTTISKWTKMRFQMTQVT